ncbi:MAG TPA: periplasmic heavy metal sensor [Burkholderiales bacterium]|nr:periplasmic heavy metal sensor [Burkholderiales bacterium]
MKLPRIVCLITFTSFLLSASAEPITSPYAGQEGRDIKSMSSEDVDAYLAGKGMGLAKTAELNGYAGPAHVLELASQLSLTPEQRTRTEALFTAMVSTASSLGRELIEEERKLDQLFANKTINPDLLNNALSRIGSLQAKVRGAHLEAHLAQVAILTLEQNVRYTKLRGYDSPETHGIHGGRHKH